MSFEWDEEKGEANFRKHGVRFTEASTIFKDLHGIELLDLYNSEKEERWIRLEISKKMKLLIVVCCERQTTNAIRIISARLATRAETQIYEKGHLSEKNKIFQKQKQAKYLKKLKSLKPFAWMQRFLCGSKTRRKRKALVIKLF